MPSGTGITLRPVSGSAPPRTVVVPASARIGTVVFSPDGKRFAFTNTRDARIDLYIADVSTGQTRMVDAAVNGLEGDCDWLDDSSGLVCGFVPTPRAAAPVEPKVPAGPNVQENHGKPGPVPTFEDMLDERARRGAVRVLLHQPARGRRCGHGPPHARSASRRSSAASAPSPDGQFVLVEKIKRPFSHLLPWNGFPKDVEVWNRRGEKARTIADVPMSDIVPINGVHDRTARVSLAADQPATLVWVEALDKGDIRRTRCRSATGS